jgi:hypothetical protein
MNGKWQSAPLVGQKMSNASGTYRGCLDGRVNGEIHGKRTGEKTTWFADGGRIPISSYLPPGGNWNGFYRQHGKEATQQALKMAARDPASVQQEQKPEQPAP